MTKYVIGPDVALALAERDAVIPPQHRLLAPTLLRSQVLAQLYIEVRRGDLTRKEANRRLDYLRALQVRLLGDRVLQQVAWQVADELGWNDTFVAEYVALTELQADALVTRDTSLARAARKVVAVATMDDLLSPAGATTADWARAG
jgi:predicted nucleic acid-binding protein